MRAFTSARLCLAAALGGILFVGVSADAKVSFTAPGALQLGYDATCTGNAGAVRYNSSGPSVQWCNGTSWTTITTGSVAASGTIGATSGLTVYLTNGSAAAPSLQFYNAATTGLYYVATSTLNFATNGVQRGAFDASGNFNLTTASGRYQFAGNDVMARPNSGGDTTSTSIGDSALANQSANNKYNTGIGPYAALTSTGMRNTAIGANTMQGPSTNSGNDNTAIGSAAMNAVAGAPAGNTAVGFNAGVQITTASNNVVVGSSTGDGLTTGKAHTFIGPSAGRTAATFSSSTSIGYNCDITAATTVTAGNSCGGGASGINTYLGALSGYGIGNASTGNTGVGEYTLNPGSGYTINNNTAIGVVALQLVRSSAASNTAAGSNSMAAVTSGSSNTAVGAYSGNTPLTTGGTNTFIGNNAQASSATISNGMAIGYNAAASTNIIQLGNASVNILYSYGTYSSTSDRRHKTGIRPLPEDLGGTFINRLEPVSYRFNHGDETLRFGFIAQDLEQALPKKLQSVIETSKPGQGLALLQRDNDAKRTYRLTYSELLASIVKSVQEQQQTLDQIDRDITDQKRNNGELTKLLADQTEAIRQLKARQDGQKSKLDGLGLLKAGSRQ